MDIKNDNEFLADYLSYYSTLNNPGYAVLVTGPWGIGKTYQVKKNISNQTICYVSLFGMTVTTEIYASVYVKMFPYKAKAKTFAKWFGSTSVKMEALTLGTNGLIGNVIDAVLKEEVDTTKIIVFDDLERCNININDVLGAINKYVEHHKCKVIVIAHDDAIEDDIANKKEKIFGQVLKVFPETKEAFNHFKAISKIPTAIEPIEKIIYDSFIASKCHSLRILQHTINDCARLLACLDTKHAKNSQILNELFLLFSAVVIAHKEGSLKEIDLQNRVHIYYTAALKKEDKSSATLISLEKKYNQSGLNLNITSKLIEDSDLINSVLNGYFNKQSINSTLNQCKYSVAPQEIRPWLKIMNFDSLETEIVSKAVKELEQKLETLDITDPNEILHSFNLLFMLSNVKEIEPTLNDILLKAKKYIRKIQFHNLFPEPQSPRDYDDIGRTGSYGYSFWVQDEYRAMSGELIKNIIYETKIAYFKRYPNIIKTLKDALIHNTNDFCSMISKNSTGKGEYAYVSVLAYIKPHEFVDIWLSLDKSVWQKVRAALDSRYSAGELGNILAIESIWLKNVRMNLSHRASKLQGIDNLRILRLIPK